MQARKRNLETVRQWGEELEEGLEREATVKRVRETCFKAFPEVLEVTAWPQRARRRDAEWRAYST